MLFFVFNAPATTEIYTYLHTLSLHDALPISAALYGSDAVAGVANIILRRTFDRLFTSARIGAATEGGAFAQQYSAVGGPSWNGGSFMLAGDFSRTGEIKGRQRPYRSEEHTSELQSLMRISYAVFCLKKKKSTIAIY